MVAPLMEGRRMKSSLLARIGSVALMAAVAACAQRAPATIAVLVPSATPSAATTRRSPVADARQLVVVTTLAWDSTSGTLRRFARGASGGAWQPVGAEVPIVVGQTGLAWDAALALGQPGEPVKREGDGKSPAGAFALDTAFGFQIGQIMPWVRLPYLQLRNTTECVDDAGSQFYNTIVDREQVTRVDWKSSERMREIDQYALGVHVRYNGTPPRRGGGSCIFLHIWAGPRSVTAGCTAMERSALEEIVRWLDPREQPMIVQLPVGALSTVRSAWGLP
ncbi:MAG: L,D-transpeptidase family protein [Gemmatimonadaceae bacterium]